MRPRTPSRDHCFKIHTKGTCFFCLAPSKSELKFGTWSPAKAKDRPTLKNLNLLRYLEISNEDLFQNSSNSLQFTKLDIDNGISVQISVCTPCSKELIEFDRLYAVYTQISRQLDDTVSTLSTKLQSSGFTGSIKLKRFVDLMNKSAFPDENTFKPNFGNGHYANLSLVPFNYYQTYRLVPCLLCLSPCDPWHKDLPSKGFTQLLHHLEITLETLISARSSSAVGFQYQHDGNSSNLEVYLCHSCLAATKNFGEVYNVHKLAKLQIDGCVLSVLQSVQLGFARRERNRPLEQLKRPDGFTDVNHFTVALNLRNLTLEKCHQLLRHMIPDCKGTTGLGLATYVATVTLEEPVVHIKEEPMDEKPDVSQMVGMEHLAPPQHYENAFHPVLIKQEVDSMCQDLENCEVNAALDLPIPLPWRSESVTVKMEKVIKSDEGLMERSGAPMMTTVDLLDDVVREGSTAEIKWKTRLRPRIPKPKNHTVIKVELVPISEIKRENILFESRDKKFIKPILKQRVKATTIRKRYQCSLCPATLANKVTLRAHMDTHLNQNRWKCIFCGKGFTQKSNRTKHLLMHFQEKPHICDICFKEFRESTLLKKHKERCRP